MYYLNTFFFYSIIGHLMESIIYLFCDGESGILFGFWTPVYGIGVVILFWFYESFKRKKMSKKSIIWNVFLIGFLLLTIIECLGGYLLEALFGIVFWNYEGLKFHIGKYISLEISLIWGILSLIAVFLLKPVSDKVIGKIPKWFTWILIFLILLDVIATILLKSNLLIFLHKLF